MRVLSEEQASQLMSDHELQLAAIEERENEALSELGALGFRVTLHELPHYLEADILTGHTAGWKNGTCYAVLYDRAGKRKHVSGISAVDALSQAQAWSRWQAGIKNDAPNKFHPTNAAVPEATVTSRVAGDTAETKRRRASTERRVLSFQSGTAEVVDAHGEPVGDTTSRASQYRERD
jgi:hypothetical protein